MKKVIIIIFLLFLILISGCYLSNQRLVKKMIDKYSDDQNYISLHGEIVGIDGNVLIIECEELKTYISYEDEISEYYVHSKNNIDLDIGDNITFTTVPFHFYNGHRLPIVELVVDNEVLLDFKDGKENLIEWVNLNFP